MAQQVQSQKGARTKKPKASKKQQTVARCDSVQLCSHSKIAGVILVDIVAGSCSASVEELSTEEAKRKSDEERMAITASVGCSPCFGTVNACTQGPASG